MSASLPVAFARRISVTLVQSIMRSDRAAIPARTRARCMVARAMSAPGRFCTVSEITSTPAATKRGSVRSNSPYTSEKGMVMSQTNAS